MCKKDRKSLKPNISITREFLNIPETIKGNIIIVCKEDKDFKSISKPQAVEYVTFLERSSFNYNDVISNKFKFLKDISIPFKSTKEDNKNVNDETLKMILAIQTVILKFIESIKN